MLTVVGIIAILVATSIPMVSNSLDKAKHSTDASNERAAKAAAVIGYLQDTVAVGTIYSYDAAAGQLVETDAGMAAYGKHNHDNMVIKVKVDDSGNVRMCWRPTESGGVSNYELCSMTDDIAHSTPVSEVFLHDTDAKYERDAVEAAKKYYKTYSSAISDLIYDPNNKCLVSKYGNPIIEAYGNHGHEGMILEIISYNGTGDVIMCWEFNGMPSNDSVSNFNICSIAGSVEHPLPNMGSEHATDAIIEQAAQNAVWFKRNGIEQEQAYNYKYDVTTDRLVSKDTLMAAYGQHGNHNGMWIEYEWKNNGTGWSNIPYWTNGSTSEYKMCSRISHRETHD